MKIIVALDVDKNEAKKLIQSIKGIDDIWVKVGPILYLQYPGIITYAKTNGLKVMLDLKFHDIPNTVEKSAQQAVKLGANMFTIHLTGGSDMIKAALSGADGSAIVLGVSILTSHTETSITEVGFNEILSIKEHVEELVSLLSSRIAPDGPYGVVCSPYETEIVRRIASDDCLIVNPGIRLPSNDVNDQKRVATPDFAKEKGADFIVVGRPVYQAPDPALVISEIKKMI